MASIKNKGKNRDLSAKLNPFLVQNGLLHEVFCLDDHHFRDVPMFFFNFSRFFGGFLFAHVSQPTELEALAASSARPRTATSPRCGTSSVWIRGAPCTRNVRPMAGGLKVMAELVGGVVCQKEIPRCSNLALF